MTIVLALLAAVAPHPAGAVADVRVTQDARGHDYTRYDGGRDAVTEFCSTSRRSQNEPTVAIDLRNPRVVVVGATDRCVLASPDVPQAGWEGYYRSTDGGASWSNSLVPGYPGDDSPAGKSSPAHGRCAGEADSTMAFDREGRLFFGFVCGGEGGDRTTMVATYDQDGAHYVRTVRVTDPSPAAIDDKPNLVVDPASGIVYMTWVKLASPEGYPSVLVVARSTDHGGTFQAPVPVISPAVPAAVQFPDMAVGPDGTLYVTYRTYGLPRGVGDAIWVARSTDGGRSFLPGQLVAAIQPFDSQAFTGAVPGTGYDAVPRCGEGPYECDSDFTFANFHSYASVAADRTGVHVIWDAERPGGQSKLFARTSPDGIDWGAGIVTLDAVARGHQWHPDAAASDGRLQVVFYDSRADPAYAPELPPGNTAKGTSSGPSVDAYLASSSDGGATWTEDRLSKVSSNPNLETHLNARIPHMGEYIYVAAAAGTVRAVWTDNRDVVTGEDPRSGADHNGFQVHSTCLWTPNDIAAAAFTAPDYRSACLSTGGLDQNIYVSALARTPQPRSRRPHRHRHRHKHGHRHRHRHHGRRSHARAR